MSVSTVDLGGLGAGTLKTQITQPGELHHCPRSKRSDHKWSRVKVIHTEPLKMIETIRCRRCLAHVIIKLDVDKCEKQVEFIKTFLYQTYSIPDYRP